MLAIKCFEGNYIKLYNNKCHLFLSGYKHEVMWANIGQSRIWDSKEQILLRINIDMDIKFGKCILKQCKKVGRKPLCTWKNMYILEPRTSKVSYESIYRIPVFMLPSCMDAQ